MESLTPRQDGAAEAMLAASSARTRALFGADYDRAPPNCEPSQRLRIAAKMGTEYAAVKDLPEAPARGPGASAAPDAAAAAAAAGAAAGDDGAAAAAAAGAESAVERAVGDITERAAKRARGGGGGGGGGGGTAASSSSSALVAYNSAVPVKDQLALAKVQPAAGGGVLALSGAAGRRAEPVPTPAWHAPWKLKTVISGHLGWVRAVAVEPGNEWFVTGAADRTIKVWDLATGTLKLTLTGHINCVRGLAVSPRHPYLFSAGEDKKVMCWDLEYNKVVRHYHGHLSGVYCLGLHPTLDVLMTGGRDSVCRVWDMRSKQQIHCLGGHKNTVVSMGVQATDPQVITGSMDSTVKMWDLAAGKCVTTLTHHKKAVRALCLHPAEWSFVTGAADNVKKWHGKDGRFMRNFSGHNAIINAAVVNQDNVLFTGADNGSMHFWDWQTGHCFQKTETAPQPGSLDSENGIYTAAFDQTGTRLITGEADKTIKIWKEDDEATPETHPIDMKAWTKQCRSQKRF